MKVRIRFLGLKEVAWNKYDFHLTPVITYTYVQKYKNTAKCLSLEWGHWAISIQIFNLNKTQP